MSSQPSWFQRHALVSLLLVNGAFLAALLAGAELFLRFYVPYNPGYYVAVRETDREVEYPYGTIRINRDGFPDDEFGPKRSLRVGYFGDSVTYGVGAGHGYRVSDLLEKTFSHYEHMNFGGIGLSISQNEIDMFLRLSEQYGLDEAVYLFNLNDILPNKKAAGDDESAVSGLQSTVLSRLDVLRGSSFLYTWVRTELKILLEAQGVGFHGYQAYELYPVSEREAVEETAHRIVRLAEALQTKGVGFTLVLLPYEMQISEEAAVEYSGRGIPWEDGFLDRGTQKVLMEALDPGVRVVDAYFAFVDPALVSDSRSRNGLGEFFVYDRGDKLDWNHPNRAGHAAIARHLAALPLFPPASKTSLGEESSGNRP